MVCIGIIVVVLIAIIAIISLPTAAMGLCSLFIVPRYCGGAANDTIEQHDVIKNKGNYLEDYASGESLFPMDPKDIKVDKFRSDLLANIAFLNMHPMVQTVVLRGCSINYASALLLFYPDKKFVIVDGSSIDIPHNKNSLSGVAFDKVKPYNDKSLLICKLPQMDLNQKLYLQLKPVGAAIEYQPIVEKYLHPKYTLLPIWADINDTTTWLICDKDASVKPMSPKKYMGRLSEHRKNINNEHYQQREDQIADPEMRIALTDLSIMNT